MIQDRSLETERNAYNAAFYALGLRWHWDSETFARLQAYRDPSERIRRYIENQHPHLLRAYDPEFLAEAIETRKAGCTGSEIYFDCAAEVGI